MIAQPPEYTTTCPECARVLPGPYEHFRYEWRVIGPGTKRRYREWCLGFEEETIPTYWVPELFKKQR